MSIDVQQPGPFDLVTNAIQIGGVAGGAFEATFSYRVHEGHDEVTGSFMAGDGVGGHGQFQLIVDVSGAAFQLDRVFVEVFHTSPKDAAELDKVVVPVILGPKIVPGYQNYLEHVVQSGETLWAISAPIMFWHELFTPTTLRVSGGVPKVVQANAYDATFSGTG